MRSILAIPASDEAAAIGTCLGALARDPCGAPLVVVLYANNCTDGTADVARAAARALGLDLRLHEETLPPSLAHAGEARRRAMALAARLATDDDLLLTTDADGRVEPGWRAANHRAVANGAAVVCGQALIDPVEALAVPAHLHEDDRREGAYGRLLDEILSLVDPDPADPWPRHGEESGASLAVRPGPFAATGGVPRIALGEDRALVRALWRRDVPIRHAPDARVVVSGRLHGRAEGGMADTMRRRIGAQDLHVDDRLEPVAAFLARARLRRRFRDCRTASTAAARSSLADRLGIDRDLLEALLRHRSFGEAWTRIEAVSRRLGAREPIGYGALPAHAARAARVLEHLRATRPALPPIGAGRADTFPRERLLAG